MSLVRKIFLILLILPVACTAEQNGETAPAESTSTPAENTQVADTQPTQTAANTAAKPAAQTQTAATAPSSPAKTPSTSDGLKSSQYRELKSPQPTEDENRIEVVEIFLYSCPHCYEFEPEVAAWKKQLSEDVLFRQMPATFGPNGENMAKAFYTAKSLKVLDTMHPVLFDAIHKRGMKLASVDEIKSLFTANGVDGKDFDNHFNSFEVDSKFRLASRMQINYGITAVPALVVNGKYRTSARLVGGSNQDALNVVDKLVAKERESQ